MQVATYRHQIAVLIVESSPNDSFGFPTAPPIRFPGPLYYLKIRAYSKSKFQSIRSMAHLKFGKANENFFLASNIEKA
jgi:hypothetical protein